MIIIRVAIKNHPCQLLRINLNLALNAMNYLNIHYFDYHFIKLNFKQVHRVNLMTIKFGH